MSKRNRVYRESQNNQNNPIMNHRHVKGNVFDYIYKYIEKGYNLCPDCRVEFLIALDSLRG